MSITHINKSAATPGTDAWAGKMTASKVAAIVGASPWDSPRSLWHKMRGDVPADDGKNRDAKGRGHYLEPSIIAWWKDRHPELTHGAEQYEATRADLPWAAATPDLISYTADGEVVVMDAKTSRDDDEWGQAGTDEIPAYYETQLIWQMHLTGAKVAYIALLTTRLDFREYRLEYNADLAAGIESLCHEFWLSTQDPDAAPPIDDTVATFQTMKRVHPEIDHGAIVELPDELAVEFMTARGELKATEARVREASSRVLERMGRARIATYWDAQVARRQGNKSGVSFVPLVDGMPELPATITRITPAETKAA